MELVVKIADIVGLPSLNTNFLYALLGLKILRITD